MAVEAQRRAEKKNLQSAEMVAFARMIREVKTVMNAMLIGHEIRVRDGAELFGGAVYMWQPAAPAIERKADESPAEGEDEKATIKRMTIAIKERMKTPQFRIQRQSVKKIRQRAVLNNRGAN